MAIDTTMNIALSSGLSAALDDPGAYAYAVYFDENGANPTWATLVNNGTVAATAPSFNWTSEYGGGKVYFIIQSVAAGTSTLTTDVTQESDLNWGNAALWNLRFDSFELSLLDSAGDQGNLTEVNGFGIPMSVSIPGVGTRGYDITGSSIFTTVQGFSPTGSQNFTYTAGPLSGQQRMMISPAEAVGNPSVTPAAFATTDWNSYLTALQANASNVFISGWFNGAPDANNVWHNAGFYSYQLSYDGANFWLSPTASSQIQGYIMISPTDLANSIYSTLGVYNVYASSSDSSTPYLAGVNTGFNNEWGTVFTQFLTGFTAGYYGGTGNASNLNPLLTGVTVDLNKTWNWDPTYAFGNDGTNSLTSGFTGNDNKYDPYAQLFFNSSNSYGSGYSDNLMSAFAAGGPLISLWDSATSSNVPTIDITLYADGESPPPPPNDYYVAPVIYNYLAPDPGGYAAATQFTGDGLNISLSFVNEAVMLADGTPVSLSWYSGGTNGTWTTVSVPTDGTIFQNWNITYDAGSDTYSLTPYATPVLTPGNMLFNGLPAADGGGITWYQIAVGSGSAAKTYNLYATTEGSGSSAGFSNPAQPGNADAIQIDGLALVSATPGTATVPSFTISFLASAFSLDPSLLTRVTDPTIIQNFPTPWAPAVGIVDSGAFSQLLVSQGLTPTPPTQAPSVASGSLAFGWVGADATAGNNVSMYTNKVSALDVADVTFASTNGGSAPSAISATADLDGNWFTANTQFGNGTYTAKMTEYLPTSSGITAAVANASIVETFTVALGSLALQASGQGNAIELADDGSGTMGNWIRLDASGSTLPNGTLLAYATDADGNLVGRDGSTGPGVTLEDAVLARIGSVASDSGTVLISGEQSVYLQLGLQMRFAILSGDGVVEQLPGVTIGGSGSLSVTVSGSHGSLHLSASVDNTLSHDAALAGSQRLYDQAWVHVTQGSSMDVEFAGSADNVNTAHFVRFDVDNATGAWSVGGVAYGNTDAFRAAVQANWDAGFGVQNGGGTFQDSTDWTVAGRTGFYAPVLVTQNGDIFVIGDANVDGKEHIRMFGENVFGFEDLRADQGGDFDYNDMIMKVTWDGL